MVHPEEIPIWTAAIDGEEINWSDADAALHGAGRLAGRQLLARTLRREPRCSRHPLRPRSPAWYTSCSNTIFAGMNDMPRAATSGWPRCSSMAERFSDQLDDQDAMIAAFEKHNDAVRAGVPAGTPARVDGVRRLGADLRAPRPGRAVRTVPAGQHHGRVPRDGRHASARRVKDRLGTVS